MISPLQYSPFRVCALCHCLKVARGWLVYGGRCTWLAVVLQWAGDVRLCSVGDEKPGIFSNTKARPSLACTCCWCWDGLAALVCAVDVVFRPYLHVDAETGIHRSRQCFFCFFSVLDCLASLGFCKQWPQILVFLLTVLHGLPRRVWCWQLCRDRSHVVGWWMNVLMGDSIGVPSEVSGVCAVVYIFFPPSLIIYVFLM